MKFGVEFAQRSVSRWRNYNIDYDLLKSLIREATSEFENISSSDNSTDTLDDHQKKLLKKLYKNFKEQIDFVSLFVFSKVGEISRRLSTLKKQCNLFIKSENDLNIDSNPSQVSLKMRKRKLLSFHKELDSITNELQDLSRFILLQKIAIKKLLKKFIKYSSYNQKHSFVDKINHKFLIENPKSFTNLTLDELALETTLLYDFLDTFLTSTNQITSNPNSSPNSNPNSSLYRTRQSSIHTIDSLQLITQSYSKSSENSTSTQLFPKSTTFDIVSIRKGPRSLKFWIHKDNLDEIKFLLSSEYKLITDDSLFTNDTRLKNTRSSLNLHDNSSSTSINNTPSFQHSTNPSTEDFCPETETVSIWLNNSIHPLFVQTAPTENFNYNITSTENIHIFKANPYSQILVSNINNSAISSNHPNANNPILITPIGGLRQFSIASLNKKMVDLLFNSQNLSINEKKSSLYNEWENSNDIKGNLQMMKLSFDWVIENNVKPLARISSKKIRFINLDSNDKINFYISLEWDIQIHQTNNDGTENSKIDNFPHAVLEINFDIPESEFPSNINNLINSHLVYRVDNLNFSLNNYLISLYINEHKNSNIISDDEMLLFIAPWHNILTDKDIRILPEIRAKSLPFDSSMHNIISEEDEFTNESNVEGSTNQINEGILLNKDDIAPTKPGYWNEFDNGSDFGGDDDGFYVYTDNDNNNNLGIIDWMFNLISGKSSFSESDDSDSRDLESNYGTGLDWLSPDKTDRILNWADNTRNFGLTIKEKILGIHDDKYDTINSESRLLNKRTNRGFSFGAINNDSYNSNGNNDDEEDEEEESDMETEAMIRLSNKNKYGKMSLIAKENHDKCLSFLYMIMIMFSLFTSSIGTLILKTVFGENHQLPKPQMTVGLLILVVFAIACMLLSILLTGFSICLLLCRYIPAPMWHACVVGLGAIVSTLFFFYGIMSCF